MMRTLIFILCLFLSFNRLFSEDAISLFKRANEYYKNSDFEKAIELYEKILKIGYESAEIYYNIGNAYFRLGKIPHSILYYERAKKLAPGDDEINFNLQIANLRIVDKIEPIPKFFLIEWIETIRANFSSSTWAIFTIIFSWLIFISLAVFLLVISPKMRKAFFAIAVFSFLMAIFTIFFSIQTNNLENNDDMAIIFSPSVTVKSSPDMNSITLFTLHEGTKLQIIDRLSDWVKIRIADGNIGWIPENSIEII